MVDTVKILGFMSVVASLLTGVACSGEQVPRQKSTAQMTTEVDIVSITPVAEQRYSAIESVSEDTGELPEYETVTGV